MTAVVVARTWPVVVEIVALTVTGTVLVFVMLALVVAVTGLRYWEVLPNEPTAAQGRGTVWVSGRVVPK
jgi:hypothetical protein